MARFREGWLVYVLMPLIWLPGLLLNLHLPTDDGPLHLYNARILWDALTGNNQPWQGMFAFTPDPTTSWISHLILGGLMSLFSPMMAEKLLYFLCLSSLPISTLFFAKTVGKSWTSVPWFVLPLAANYCLNMGFYSFCMGLSLQWVVLAIWWRDEGSWGRNTVYTLLPLFVLLYLCHIMVLFMTCAAIFILSIARAWSTDDRSFSKYCKRVWQLGGSAFFSFLPTALLVAAFVVIHPLGIEQRLPPVELLELLLGAKVLVSYEPLEELIASVYTILLVSITIGYMVAGWKGTIQLRHPGLLWLALTMLLLHFLFANNTRTGSFINIRVPLFIMIPWAIWIGVQELPLLIKRSVMVVAITLAGLQASAHFYHFEKANRLLAEMDEVAVQLEASSVLLPVIFYHSGTTITGGRVSRAIGYFQHHPARIALANELVLLENYQTRATEFAIHFKPEFDPRSNMGWPYDGIGKLPPMVSPTVYQRRTGVAIRYVLVWQPFGKRAERIEGVEIMRWLAEEYELRRTSFNGNARLYERKPGEP